MLKGHATLAKILRISIPLILTALWIAFIWSNSLKNGVESGEDSGRVYTIVSKTTESLGLGTPISEHSIRKTAHFTEFAILGVLFCADLICLRAVCFDQKVYVSAPLLLCSIPASVLFASADEFLQNFSDGRGPSVKDVLIDTAGALCSTIIFIAVFILVRFIHKKRCEARVKNQYALLHSNNHVQIGASIKK